MYRFKDHHTLLFTEEQSFQCRDLCTFHLRKTFYREDHYRKIMFFLFLMLEKLCACYKTRRSSKQKSRNHFLLHAKGCVSVCGRGGGEWQDIKGLDTMGSSPKNVREGK